MPAALFLVHLDSIQEWRGGQEALLQLARELAARGHRQIIVCPADSVLNVRARAAGIETAPYPSRLLRRTLALRRLLQDADLVHAHTGHAQTALAIACRGLRVARVVTRHTAFVPRQPRIHALKYGGLADGIIAVSEAVRRVLIDSGVDAEKIQVIHTGVQIPATLPTAEQRRTARAQFGLNPEDFVIGHLGAFTREKGQDLAVRAAALLKTRIPQARMLLAGNGPFLEEAKALAANTPVVFPGFVEDRASFFAALDVFLMPSRSEAWGLAALEAMARGIPVIASNVEGLKEIVDPQCGWLVPTEDSQAIAEAVQSAASDEQRLREAGLAARRRAEAFSCQQTVDQTEAFYRQVLRKIRGSE